MNDSTELVFVIDRSGSMQSIRDEAIGGFNALLADQQAAPGEARITLVLFDHEYDVAIDAAPLAEAEPLTPESYVPRGTTALLDAVGRTVDAVGARLAATDEAERPRKVLVCIITDGMENASSDYTRDRVREMIEHQQEVYGWEFQFLAAGQDAFAEAGSIGIKQDDALNWTADSLGTGVAFSVASERSSSFRQRE